MNCDINLLKYAIYYYKLLFHSDISINELEKTIFDIDTSLTDFNNEVEILDEAIDFHPFPQILNYINKKTNIQKDIIKDFIWNIDSGYNCRKYNTKINQQKYSERKEWDIIKNYLEDIRCILVY
jgi:tRNA A-37 threonylcarbamoyl transferase component Bud32